MLRLLLALAMAVSNLTNGAIGVPGASKATASITPASMALIKASISQHSDATPPEPTCAGNGLTWVKIATIVYAPITTGVSRTTLFRAMGASPSAGAVTFSGLGSPAEGICWSIDQDDATDTSGTNGSGAIVQAVTGAGTAAGESITLAAITPGNRVFGALSHNASSGTTADTVGSGFTALANVGWGGSPDNDGHILTEWKLAQTTVDATAGSTSGAVPGWGGVAIEIKAAASVSAALTGTATASITETDIVTGGKTIILTLTGDTWRPA